MKELSIEEKANAYDKVREKIALRFGSNVAEDIFSEFEISEDEKIRRELIAYLKNRDYDIDDKWLAWLEKQGEPNPAWSEEDRDLMYDTLSNLTELKDLYGKDYGKVGKCIDWLKSLKKRLKGK